MDYLTSDASNNVPLPQVAMFNLHDLQNKQIHFHTFPINQFYEWHTQNVKLSLTKLLQNLSYGRWFQSALICYIRGWQETFGVCVGIT